MLVLLGWIRWKQKYNKIDDLILQNKFIIYQKPDDKK